MRKALAVLTLILLFIATTVGVYYGFVYLPEKRPEERIQPLIDAGLEREEALKFDETYGDWAPYNKTAAEFARYWVNFPVISEAILETSGSLKYTITSLDLIAPNIANETLTQDIVLEFMVRHPLQVKDDGINATDLRLIIYYVHLPGIVDKVIEKIKSQEDRLLALDELAPHISKPLTEEQAYHLIEKWYPELFEACKEKRVPVVFGDIDEDGKNHYDEIFVYGTDPLKPNPNLAYAIDKKISLDVAKKLMPLDTDGKMDENERSLVDYLFNLTQAEVVSPEVSKFVSPEYKAAVISDLQLKLIGDLVKDGKVPVGISKMLPYLSTFDGLMQRDRIEFGLDNATITLLNIASQLDNQMYAKWIVENRVCIEDHKLTDLERKFLLKPHMYSKELLDQYLLELNQSYPELAKELKNLPELRASELEAKVDKSSEHVCLLVKSSVYEPLMPWIERWMMDVKKTGVKVDIRIVEKESASEIRALLKSTPNLTGCLIVGDIPWVKYEMDFILYGKPFHEEFPTDLYYADLDGDWLDRDNDGIFDTHVGNIAPEIWVGRLKASTLSEKEIDLLRNYFDKNHLYRIGALTLPHRALMYTDHYLDYYTYELTPRTTALLKNTYGEVVSVTYPQKTTADDYLDRLKQGWSFVRLFAHSGGFGHYFGNQTDGKVYPSDIRKLDPKAFFYTIVSCENFDYTRSNYMGGCYVFTQSYSLLAIGQSGIHDTICVLPEEFFPYIQSKCFGSALLHYLQKCVEKNARIDSVHNTIMIGDPLLKPVYNGLDSDGDGLSDHYELAVGLNPHDGDTDHDRLSDLEDAKFIEFLRFNGVDCVEALEDILTLVKDGKPYQNYDDRFNASKITKANEVWEAFDLMLKGGTPDLSDFNYTVPPYNTELQVLYWLAEQNELKKYDTLAQAIAMVNSLWVTMGDEQVRQAVYKDINDLLNFFRETNEIQKARGYYQLEDYPLEAKVALAWTGNYSPSGGRVYPLRFFLDRKLDLQAYDWNTVSLETLKKMRELVVNNSWLDHSIDKSIKNIEDYFYFGSGDIAGGSNHWRYASDAVGHSIIIVDGKEVANHDLNNVDYLFREYLEKNFVTGECGDEAILIEAFLKSSGIPATFVIRQAASEEKILDSHMYVLYYDPSHRVWKAYEKQLNVGIDLPYRYTLYIAKPPTNEKGYLKYWLEPTHRVVWYGHMYHIIENLSIQEIKNMFSMGQSTQRMKEWLLFS